MNNATPLSQLETSQTIPGGSLHMVEMGDGSGTKTVTQEVLTQAVGEGLKIGDLEELETDNKESIVEAINEVAQSGGGGASVDILDTQEEIEANTESGKAAGASAVKEMFTELNDKINDNILTYNESEDAYYIQHGADSVPKKLGSGGFKRTTIFTGNSREGHTVNLSNRPRYQNFTLDNFCLKTASLVYDNEDLSVGGGNIINSYNPTTGVLTLSKSCNSMGGRYFYISYSIDLIEQD